MSKSTETLYDRLIKLNKSDMLPLHMPGHKRGKAIPAMADIYSIDITEIEGFDDLHEPSGVIADMERRAAELYGADKAWISVNGSSGALEAAILGVCRVGDKVIIPRGSHKSVYYAMELGGLRPCYLKQRYANDSDILLPPTVSEVACACDDHSDAACVLITSPTYEGLMADVESIAAIAHASGRLLIVDCAHGAHMGVTDVRSFSYNTIRAGADIAVVSLHKMLPAPTQTALLLTGGERITDMLSSRIGHYMRALQSSSPSYVLMAGVDECLKYMSEGLESDLMGVEKLSANLRQSLANLRHIDVNGRYEGLCSDPLKVVIRSHDGRVSGQDLFNGLIKDYHIQCEMYASDYALALFSPTDGETSFTRLRDALLDIDVWIDRARGESVSDIDADVTANARGEDSTDDGYVHIPVQVMTPSEAMNHNMTFTRWSNEAKGRICASYMCVYPPGIPMIVPGELIDDEVFSYIERGRERGLNITGIHDGLIEVADTDE